MKLGYVRVSRFDDRHSAGLQMGQLREYGCRDEDIFVDAKTGMSGHRPAFNALMDRVELGDEVVVWKLDRIARSPENLVLLVEMLRAKGASLRTLGEGVENLDTSLSSNTQHHRLFELLSRFNSSIDFERIESSKTRNSPRRSDRVGLVLDWRQIEYAQSVISQRSISVRDLCKELGVSSPTLYQYVGPDGELRSRGIRVMRMREIYEEKISA